MLRLLIITITLLSFVGYAFGQATVANCPTVQVIGPSHLTNPGQSFEFLAKIGPSSYKLTYKWSVSNGSIVEGQGSPTITATSDNWGVLVVGTLKVEGLPDGCTTEAYGYAPITPQIPIVLIDEWGILPPNEVRARMDILFSELIENPDDTGIVFLRVLDKEKHTSDNPRLKLMVRHAKFRKFDLGRLLFNIEPVDGDRVSTRLYRVGNDVDLPCRNCIAFPGNSLQ